MEKPLPDRRTLLKLLGASGLAALTGLAGFQAGRATSVQEQIPITKGSFASPADYILFQDGSVYKIKNGLTGAIEFQGASKTEALNSLLSKYSTFSGVIYDRDTRQYESYLNGSLLTTLPIYKQTPQIPASYIVYKDGDVIKVKNGQTGQVEFSGSDAATIIQSVIDAVPDGSLIFINEGTNADPDFWYETFAQENGSDLIVPTLRSSPVVIDLDGDGKKDILAGNTEGQLLFYSNVGTDSSPEFSGYTLLEADGNVIDLMGAGDARSRPFVCDWNDDGIGDILVGAGDGKVYLFRGVPEPASLSLLIIGGMSILLKRRR